MYRKINSISKLIAIICFINMMGAVNNSAQTIIGGGYEPKTGNIPVENPTGIEILSKRNWNSKTFLNQNNTIWNRKLFWGNNIEVLYFLSNYLKNKIDMVYIDPPFFSGTNYHIQINEKDKKKSYAFSLRQQNHRALQIKSSSPVGELSIISGRAESPGEHRTFPARGNNKHNNRYRSHSYQR